MVTASFPLLVLLATLGSSAAAAPITLYYEERAPYLVQSGDQVQGLAAAPAAQAFKAADIAFVWKAASMSRQWHMMRQDSGANCVVGWFKTSERAAFAKFTKPVFRDGPVVALVRRQLKFSPVKGLQETLSTPGMRVLVRSKYSYGARIDDALGRIKVDTIASPLGNAQLVERLVEGRADLMFSSEEEAAVLLRGLGSKAGAVQLLRFSDLLPGQERYIACNRNVPDETIERLNDAIDFK